MDIVELVRNLGIGGIFLVAILYALRKYLDRTLTRDLERFKSDLRFEATKHELVFSRLHERRATVIAELYAAIADLEKAMDIFLDLRGKRPEFNSEQGTRVSDCGNHADNCFRRNRIYFDPHLCKKIEALLKRFYGMWVDTVPQRVNGRDVPIGGHEWLSALGELKEKIPPIREKIEEQFREMIGVSDQHLKTLDQEGHD